MPCFDDVVFIIGYFSGCIVSVLIFIWFYLFDKLTDIMQERKQKKKREYEQQENYDYKFNKLCSQVEQIIDFLNDNECSVKDDD